MLLILMDGERIGETLKAPMKNSFRLSQKITSCLCVTKSFCESFVCCTYRFAQRAISTGIFSASLILCKVIVRLCPFNVYLPACIRQQAPTKHRTFAWCPSENMLPYSVAQLENSFSQSALFLSSWNYYSGNFIFANIGEAFCESAFIPK